MWLLVSPQGAGSEDGAGLNFFRLFVRHVGARRVVFASPGPEYFCLAIWFSMAKPTILGQFIFLISAFPVLFLVMVDIESV